MNNLIILSAALLRSQQNMVLVGVSLAEGLVLLATVLLLYPPISQRQSQLLALLFTFSGLAKVCWGASLLYSFNMQAESEAIVKAVETVLEEGYRTADLARGGVALSTTEMTDIIIQRLS